MENKKITVLMPVYNVKLDLLDRAIKSILDQSYLNFDFLIINDGAKEDIVRRLEFWKKIDNRIIILHNLSNRGLVYTLNKGLAHCKTALVARMDADDFSYKDRLEKQVEYMEQHPDVVVLGTAAIYQETGRRLQKTSPRGYSQILSCLIFYCCICHPTVMMRRREIMEIGGYPNFQYAEDYALWVKLAFETSYRIEILDDVCLSYTRGEKSKYDDRQKKSTASIYNYIEHKLKINSLYYRTENGYDVDDEKKKEKFIEDTKTLDNISENAKLVLPLADPSMLDFCVLREKKKILKKIARKNGLLLERIFINIKYFMGAVTLKFSH